MENDPHDADQHGDDLYDPEYDRATDPAAGPAPEPGDGVRLQKVLAQAGLGSRRACEELIDAGRVEVDGRRITEQGVRVDPDRAEIRVDGARLSTRAGSVYLLLNKPVGIVSTMNDPEGRPCLGDYVADHKERLYHVGRLDTDTEGLILLTNDGELTHRLTHPSFGVAKTYVAEVPGPIARDLGKTLRKGFDLDDGHVSVDGFRLLDFAHGRALVEVVVHEGRNHIVRRLLEAAGHPVSRLVRTQIGPVGTGNLAPGRLRHLTTHEVSALFTASEQGGRAAKATKPSRAARKPTPSRATRKPAPARGAPRGGGRP